MQIFSDNTNFDGISEMTPLLSGMTISLSPTMFPISPIYYRFTVECKAVYF